MSKAQVRSPFEFLSNKSGAVAPLFVLTSTLVLFPMTGAAIDLTRVYDTRVQLQDSLDAAALAIGRMPVNSTPEQVQSAADRWVMANLRSPDLQGLKVTVHANYADARSTISSIDLQGAGTVTSVFQGSIGGVAFGNYKVGARSSASWGVQRVELALVLDNTGSMNESDGSGGTKSTALKTAAKGLIDAVSKVASGSGDPDAFKVGMVPFGTYVNVGTENRGAWLTGTSPYAQDVFTTPTNRFTLFDQMHVSWAGCVESRPMPYDVQDTAPTPGVPDSAFVPYFAPDEPDDATGGRDQYSNNYLPDGVPVTAPFAVKQGRPDKYTSKPMRAHANSLWGDTASNGPNKDCPNVPLIRLTRDYAAVKSAVDRLAPEGNTHIPLGMAWGWHVISPNAPFADGKPYTESGVKKIVILVTDGANTYFAGSASPSVPVNNAQSGLTDNSIYTSYGYVWQKRIAQTNGSYADPARAMDDRLTLLCSNMKAAGLTIYTIPLRITDAPTKARLQGCASTPDDYLEANSGAQLQAQFQKIAASITTLRLTK